MEGRNPISVTELATTVGVAERTLRTAFNQHFGVGPARYLQLRRLHSIYRALRESEPDETSVAQVFVHHGEWEFGRVAGRYRALFGELPSETLRGNRRTNTKRIRPDFDVAVEVRACRSGHPLEIFLRSLPATGDDPPSLHPQLLGQRTGLANDGLPRSTLRAVKPFCRRRQKSMVEAILIQRTMLAVDPSMVGTPPCPVIS